MKRLFSVLVFVLTSWLCKAQVYPGHDKAVHRDSSIIITWASHCTVIRGLQQINNPSLGYASSGTPEDATGMADNTTVSLGDGGMAVLNVDVPVKNGAGYDFVVFENGFSLGIPDSLFFLEFAFVEVSSDGQHYVCFPSVSNTDTTIQITNADGMSPGFVKNLAGRYAAPFGTPFDLEDLKDSTGLDLGRITHIRIIDVVGSLNDQYASRDAGGRKINDPWPTAFPSSGFDLDAVGIIHTITEGFDDKVSGNSVSCYPMPALAGKPVRIDVSALKMEVNRITLYTPDGRIARVQPLQEETLTTISVAEPGIYLLHLETSLGTVTKKLIIQ